MIYIGTAGWTLPRDARGAFPAAASNLASYAQVFNGLEINSTFRKSHRKTTYARWAQSVPESFRFSVKVPKAISHVRGLVDARTAIHQFIDDIEPLHRKLGCILLQLPPSLGFDEAIADAFFADLRATYVGPVALEPRHASWTQSPAIALLQRYDCDVVWADPAVVPLATRNKPGFAYFRLHGWPHVYSSSYSEAFIADIAGRISALPKGSDAWCIFDNTARGAAIPNAIAMQRRIAT
jgi:uncharacterized protein YecE (DUF72 family)